MGDTVNDKTAKEQQQQDQVNRRIKKKKDKSINSHLYFICKSKQL